MARTKTTTGGTKRRRAPRTAAACTPAPGPSTALVLAGGGAFGAYEAGVLLYLFDELPRETGCRPRFDVFAGTSAGALNVSFLAASVEDPGAGARRLAQFWRSLTLEQVARFGFHEMRTLGRLFFGPARARVPATRPPRAPLAPHAPVAGLFDTAPLRARLEELVPWGQLQANLERGLVRGLALCATEVCTGTSVVFYQTAPGTELRVGRDPAKEVRRVTIGIDHALASAAIPFIFPAVLIDGVCYTDGGLRQNTPLNPALRLGADRVLVVSLTQRPGDAKRQARLGCRRNPYPGALFLLGRTVPILMSQSLDYELQRVSMYNRLISGGCEHYGPGFVAALNEILAPERNATYRPVRTCHVRPSASLSHLARLAAREAPPELILPGFLGRLVGRALASASLADSDLSGYLMFAPQFTGELVDLGFRDAREQRDELARFFAD
jgi:NTE family protein